MKHLLHITALFDKPELMANLVETLAVRRNDDRYENVTMPKTWEGLTSSTVESFVSGTLEMDFDDEQMRIPFTSSFLFVCTKKKKEAYKLCWSVSLS